MAAQTQLVRSDLLRNILRGNSIFSTATGLLLIVGAAGIAAFLGVPNAATVLLLMGVLILGFAALVFWGSNRENIDPRFGWLIFAMDVAWVVISIIILARDAFALTTEGRWAVLIVADIVAVFALLEYLGLRRLH
jgi:hypothetical protein